MTAATVTSLPKCQVVFVLGGPGSGKSTICKLLTERLLDDNGLPKWTYLSAGDLLREERSKDGDSELTCVINEIIRKGALVPSDVMCRLIEQGMERVYRKNNSIVKFLIDGFPRSHENAAEWRDTMSSKHNVSFVMNLTCPEEVLEDRLLQCGNDADASGDDINAPREDDANLTIIRKRFRTFQTETEPVIDWYKTNYGQGLLRTVASDRPIEDVYRDVARLVLNLCW